MPLNIDAETFNKLKIYSKSYYSIPIEVLNECSSTASLLYGYINALSNNVGCWATNGYLAKQLNVERRTITRLFKELEDKHFIYTEMVLDERTGIKRRYVYPLVIMPITIYEGNAVSMGVDPTGGTAPHPVGLVSAYEQERQALRDQNGGFEDAVQLQKLNDKYNK